MVPSHFPPGKLARASFNKRLSWTRATLEGLKKVVVSSFEADTKTSLFGIDIYRHFSALYLAKGPAEFSWILGSDQWEQLAYWLNIDSYAHALTWVVLNRNEFEFCPSGVLSRRLAQSTCSYRWAKTPLFLNISSSSLREGLEERGRKAPELSWIAESIKDEVIMNYSKGENH